MVPHRSQYVDPLDFRRQRRGQNGSGSLYHFLFALRHGCWAHSSIRESRLNRAIGRRIWRYCRSPRCLFSLFPNGTSAGDVSDLLFPILLRNSGCVLSSSLVFHAIIQRHDGSGWSPTGRWYRLVGTHRGICRRNALVLVVCGKTEPPNATRRIWVRMGVGAAPPLDKGRTSMDIFCLFFMLAALQPVIKQGLLAAS